MAMLSNQFALLFLHPMLQSLAVIIVALTFCLGWCLLVYLTMRLIKGAVYYNHQTINAAPVCICLVLAIITATLALFAAMGVWQLYVGVGS